MPDTRLRWLTAVVAAGLVLVVALGTIVGSSTVARGLQPRVEQALVAAGLDGVLVDVDGREAVLSGGSTADLREAREVVEDVHGVRWAKIADEDEPTASEADDDASAASSATIGLERVGDGVEIGGVVPDSDAAADIKTAASLTFDATVSGDLRVDPSLPSASWVDALPGLLGDVAGVKQLRIAVDGTGSVEIRGEIESEAGRSRVVGLVAAALPDLEVVDGIEIDPGGLDEADASVLNGATVLFLEGMSTLTADDQRTLDVVADVLRRNVDVRVEAGGHTGGEDSSRSRGLTAERVAAVKSFLVSRGIEARRITSRTYGTDGPSPAGTSAQQLRRVDFIVKES